MFLLAKIDMPYTHMPLFPIYFRSTGGGALTFNDLGCVGRHAWKVWGYCLVAQVRQPVTDGVRFAFHMCSNCAVSLAFIQRKHCIIAVCTVQYGYRIAGGSRFSSLWICSCQGIPTLFSRVGHMLRRLIFARLTGFHCFLSLPEHAFFH